MANKVAEIKKDDNGKLWVRREGKKKFVIVQDDTIAAYLIYLLIVPEHK